MTDADENVARPGFAEEAQAAIQQLRSAVAGILEKLPIQATSRPARLADALRIDNQLAWKISKIVTARDCFLASQYVPGAAGLRIFLGAAAKHDVGKDAIKHAQDAFDDFRAVMKTHADDRKSARAMLASHVTEDRARLDLMHRKGAFTSFSYILGVQTRVHLQTYVINASKQDDLIDVATIRGFVDLKWIRPDISWRISRFYTLDAQEQIQTSFDRKPLCPPDELKGLDHDLPLIPQFCSQPLPKVQRTEGNWGSPTYQLLQEEVGNTGVLTCIIGEVVRGAEPRFRTGDHNSLGMLMLPRTPCETLIFDMVIHRDVIGRLNPQSAMFADLFNQAASRRPAELDRLPLHDRVAYCGLGADAAQTPEIPRYPELIRYALGQLEWPEENFDVYRLQIAYPPIPSAVLISQDLPAGPPEKS